MVTETIGWLLGLDRVAEVRSVRPTLGAEWATRGSGPFWMVLALAGLIVLVALFYRKFQTLSSRRLRWLLTVNRTTLLILLLATLAEPVLRIKIIREGLPTLFVVFDGTASMDIRDRMDADQRAAWERATGLTSMQPSDVPPRRQDFVRGWLRNSDSNVLQSIGRERECRIESFVFDGQTTSRVRRLSHSNSDNDAQIWEHVAGQLSSNGEVTAIGSVLRDLARQPGARSLAGVVLVSDFVQNSGELPLSSSGADASSPVGALKVPIYTLGVGIERSRDVAVQLAADPKIRRGEKTELKVSLRQTGLDGQTAKLLVAARVLDGAGAGSKERVIARRTIVMDREEIEVEVPYIPARAGERELRVAVEAVEGESVVENNRIARRIQIVDDFIRLLYVAYEPTWEWRFVKEVFHRDPAVGMNGFRTFLASSDPRVREANPLFLPTLAMDRGEFFEHDVIFLDDLPKSELTPRFCEMVEQFVRDLGGGLVVMAGPRFGPDQLRDTRLAAMLPVILDAQSPLRDQKPFPVQLTIRAREQAFMQIDDTWDATLAAWKNMGTWPWYRPVANAHEQAVVLAEHPTDVCLDGVTRQPLITIRRFGAGEVVYIASNELWRLRRMHGEKYYRRFWLPMIDRLGLSHALGPRKRFVPYLDRRSYRVDDEVIVSVHAYDRQYEPLDPASLEGGVLQATLIRESSNANAEETQPVTIPALRPGLFETRFPVYAPGVYRLRVRDPLASGQVERRFEVTGATAELRSSVRDVAMQESLASASRGASYTLLTAKHLRRDLRLKPKLEMEEHSYPLWNTPVWFILVIALMLFEWAVRKWNHLA